ncbi:NADH:flavin oxidoreductase/NADH oxidase [Streptomyces sp. NPDC026673]|uniref:oxidoreductase n=1 Tax=Streptomyces sp. NPDC026673 TaxID=3155724 RepID=UPI0034058DB5
MSTTLFEPITLRSLTVPNRIWMDAMCQAGAAPEGERAGVPDDWHFAHLAARATGGAGLILSKATAVSPENRLGPYDLGIWNDTQVEAFRRITAFLKSQGTVPGVQLAAGRGEPAGGGWVDRRFPVTPGKRYGWAPGGSGTVPFAAGSTAVEELGTEQIGRVVADFADAAGRALDAGFQVAEIHGVHGYLVNQFLSPHSNHRTDGYGGDFMGRTRFALEVVEAVRAVWPQDLPVFFRMSSADGPGESGGDCEGWTADDTVRLAKELQARGVDLMDVPAPRHRVPVAERVRDETGMPVAAVGPLTGPARAQALLRSGGADAVLLGQELLRDPYWPLHAASALGGRVNTPVLYHVA